MIYPVAGAPSALSPHPGGPDHYWSGPQTMTSRVVGAIINMWPSLILYPSLLNPGYAAGVHEFITSKTVRNSST